MLASVRDRPVSRSLLPLETQGPITTNPVTSVISPPPTVSLPARTSATVQADDYPGHYVENIGNTTLRFLEVFNTGE